MGRTIWVGIFILTFLKLNAQSVFLNGYSFVDGPRELFPEPTSITVMGDFFFQGYEELKESIYDSLFSSYAFEYAGDEIFGIGGFILDYTYIDQNLRLTIPGGVGIRTTILTPMTPYQWVNYACVLDVEKQTISLYIDGEFIAEKPYVTDDGDWEADNRVTIGGSDQRTGDGFNGKLSNFNVWGEALDQNEIQFFRHQSPTGLESNLMLSWDFSTIENATIRDRTSNMHHGILQTGTSLRSDRPFYLLPIENIDLHLHRIEMVDFENLLIGHNPLTISLINYGKNQVSDFQASFYLNDSLIATEQINQVILPRSRFDYTFQTPLHVDTGEFHLDIEVTGLRADFLGNSSLQSEYSIKHQQIFPETGAVYGKHEVTHLRWKSDLDPTFQNRLQVATDSLYENLILDTAILPYKEYLIEDDYGPPDSLEVRLPIFDEQFDLMNLLEENMKYHWRLISSNDSTQYELESHFFIDSTRIVVFKDEIGDTFEAGDYIIFGKEAKVSFDVKELGIVRDINIGYTINQHFRCKSSDGFNGFISLISPSGTKIRLSKNHELFSISNTRYYDDEAFVSDTIYYDLFNDMGLPDHYNACIYNPLPRYPNFRLKPYESLSTLIDEESSGTWTLTVDMDKLDGSISNVSLEIAIESHPIEVFVSKSDLYSANLEWNADQVYQTYHVQRSTDSSDFETIHETDQTSYTDTTLTTPNQVVVYRIVGSREDQDFISNEAEYRTWLEQPTINERAFYISHETDYEWIVQTSWNSTGSSLGYLLDDGRKISTYDGDPPTEVTTTPFRIATFHQFDTSQWSDPVSYTFELLSPENGGIVSLNEIGDFEWFSDMQSEARLIIGKSRDERGKIIPDFEAKNVDHKISLTTSESVALFDDVGEYYWSIILKESEFFQGIFLSKQGSFTIEEKPLSTPTQQLAEVWPNPVAGNLTLETKSHFMKKIALVDLSGKKVLEKNTSDQIIVINTEGIKNGIYLLQVTTSGNSYTHKVIIAN